MFRKEVFEAKKNQWLGYVHILTPISYYFIGIFSLILVGVFFVFVFFGQYTHREKVSGQVIPEQGVVSIAVHDAGFISRLYVKQDDIVTAGTPLFEVSKSQSSEGIGDVNQYLNEKLELQKAALKKDLKNNKEIYVQNTHSLNERLLSLADKRKIIEQQITLSHTQSGQFKKLFIKMNEAYKKHYVSEIELQRQQLSIYENEQQIKNLNQQLLDNQHQFTEITQQLNKIPFEFSGEENNIAQSLAEIDKLIATNKINEKVMICARQSGVISSVLFEAGQRVSAGDTIMSLLPENSTYRVKLFVPSQSMGFIDVGNRVVLRYQAYSYQKFGQQYGCVAQISRNTLTARQITEMSGIPAHQPFYQVLVRLDKQYIDVYGKREPLMADMLLDADIMMDTRTLAEWIFEPLHGLKQKYAEKKGS